MRGNDYDEIARQMGGILECLISHSHEPHDGTGDSLTTTKDGYLSTIIRLARLQAWVHGLAETHRLYQIQKATIGKMNDERDEETKRAVNLREEAATLCHSQWSGWMGYMFSKADVNKDGSWTMPAEFVERWMRQAATPYIRLSFAEKDSDRTEADKFIDLFARLS